MQKAVHPAEVDKRAEVGQVLDRARHRVADVDTLEKFLAFLAPLLLDQFTPAENDVFPVVVDLNDLKIVGIPDKLLEIARRDDIDLRSRQERFDADVHHQAAFYDRLHFALDQAVSGKDLGNLVPILAIGSLFLRKDDHALVVLETLEKHFNLIPHFERLDVVELRRRDHALRLVADIHEHFAWPDFQNAPLHNAAFFEVGHRLRHHILHLQHKRWALLVTRVGVKIRRRLSPTAPARGDGS